MKKVLLTTLMIVLMGSVLIYAGGPKGPKGPNCTQIIGEIDDIGFDTITIGNDTILVTDDTMITSRNTDIDSFDDLKTAMTVVVCAQVDDGGDLIACKINVKYKGN